MLKRFIIFITTFSITILITAFISGSLLYLMRYVNMFGAKVPKSNGYQAWFQMIEAMLYFSIFTAIVYFATTAFLIYDKRRLTLYRRCIVGIIATFCSIVFLLIITYGFGWLTIKSFCLLIVFFAIHGCCMAFTNALSIYLQNQLIPILAKNRKSSI